MNRPAGEPWSGITAQVTCAVTPQQCKAAGHSFFIFYIHSAITALNGIPALRDRFAGNTVIRHPQIDPAVTVARHDGTFAFVRLPFSGALNRFTEEAVPLLAEARSSTGLVPTETRSDLAHFSVAPWLPFTGISHARRFTPDYSIPIISIGGLQQQGNSGRLPAALHAHRALVTEQQCAQWFALFEKGLALLN